MVEWGPSLYGIHNATCKGQFVAAHLTSSGQPFLIGGTPACVWWERNSLISWHDVRGHATLSVVDRSPIVECRPFKEAARVVDITLRHLAGVPVVMHYKPHRG